MFRRAVGSTLTFGALALALALGSACAGGGSPQPSPKSGAAADPGPSEVPSAMFEATAPTSTPQAAPGSPVKSDSIPIAGTDFVRGRATLVVDGPLAKVREVLLDFEKYPEFMPEFSGGKILGRTRDGTLDVYQEMKILKGSVRIWAHIKVPKATVVDAVESYVGEYLEGNLEAYETTWRIRPVDDTHTELTAEFFLRPKFPVPTGWMNGKNVEGATKAVVAVKHRVEGTPPEP
jgi:ribosome-associated toxin RatA of RatAB toxin-antitoxin module